LASTTSSISWTSLDSSSEEAIKAKEAGNRTSLKEANIIKDLIIKHIKTNSITKIRDLLRTIVVAAKTTTITKADNTVIPEEATVVEEGEEITEKSTK
jgi:hypothetical protein